METNKKLEEIHKDIKEIKRILTIKDKDGHFVICNYCAYTWKSRSNKDSVSCPNCNKKTKNISADEKLKGLSDVGKQTESHIDKEYKKGKSVYDLDLEE